MSCTHAQEFLENEPVTIEEVVDARKIRIDADAAWAMLKTAASVSIAKGRKIQKFSPADGQETILKQAMGPSGNLRAPTYRVGDNYVIGFNTEMYEDWVK